MAQEKLELRGTRRENVYCVIDQHLGLKKEYGYYVIFSRCIIKNSYNPIGAVHQDPELQIDMVQEEYYESYNDTPVFETQ